MKGLNAWRNRRIKNGAAWISMVVLLVLFLSACGNDSDPGETAAPNQPAESPGNTPDETQGESPAPSPEEPKSIDDMDFGEVELFIKSNTPSITMEEFEETMVKPLKQKFPHYTLRYENAGDLLQLVTTGDVPDILIYGISALQTYLMPYELVGYDITQLVDKYNYDLSRFDNSTIESAINASGVDKLYGLPKYLNGITMFYNKELFDSFGRDYPTDGMTWDEVHALAVDMTRVENGEQHRGMSMFFGNMMEDIQANIPLIHPTEPKSNMTNPHFQKYFSMLKSFYDIQGNKPGSFDHNSSNSELDNFYKARNIAMVLSPMSGYGRFVAEPSFDWDLVAAPTFADNPGVGYTVQGTYYFINDINGKVEPAFQAITTFLSDELQIAANKAGRPTSLKDPEIRATLAQDDERLRGKNFQALFYNNAAPVPAKNLEFTGAFDAVAEVRRAFARMISENQDVNTMLRQADERINQKIREAIELNRVPE